jgi:Zn-dependent alcohol dehydrogenase
VWPGPSSARADPGARTGSVTNMSDARSGDVVIVRGIGGVGINSVQAARAIGMRQSGIPINHTMFTVFQKRLQGSLFGGCNPRWDIPNLLAQYTAGALELDALVTRTYTLEQVAQGYADMRDGVNIRGLVVFN